MHCPSGSIWQVGKKLQLCIRVIHSFKSDKGSYIYIYIYKLYNKDMQLLNIGYVLREQEERDQLNPICTYTQINERKVTKWPPKFFCTL